MTLYAKMTTPDSQRYSKKLCLITCEIDIYACFCLLKLFSFSVSMQKCLAYFLLIRSNGEIIRVKHLSSQKNYNIFHIFDQTKFARVLMYFRNCQLSMKSFLKTSNKTSNIWKLYSVKVCLFKLCKIFFLMEKITEKRIKNSIVLKRLFLVVFFAYIFCQGQIWHSSVR